MSLIIAARFETVNTAEQAARQLLAAGVTSDNIHTFYVNQAGHHGLYPLGGDEAVDPDAGGAFMGAVSGAVLIGLIGAALGALLGYLAGFVLMGALVGLGAGAYIGSLFGAMRMIGKRRRSRPPRKDGTMPNNKTRPSGMLLAVHVTSENSLTIARLLRDAGGMEVERAHGRWEDGGWKDFDPLEGPELQRNL